MKLTQAKLKQLEQDYLAYNRFLKQRHMERISFDEYVNQVFGRVKPQPVAKNTEIYKPKTPVRYTDRKQYPSVMGTGLAVCAKSQPQTYSGEQKLLGIATLHKSNMVPVFAKQDAEDIARMRRN